MKLKKQFDRIGGNRLNEAQMIHGVDYSTLKLKSNIDQKWGSVEDMTKDMRQWMEALYIASGPEMIKDIQNALEDLTAPNAIGIRKDSKNDPFYKSDSYLD